MTELLYAFVAWDLAGTRVAWSAIMRNQACFLACVAFTLCSDLAFAETAAPPRFSTGMMASGIVLLPIGAGALASAAVVGALGHGVHCGSDMLGWVCTTGEEIATGLTFASTGALAIGGGITMIVLGARRVSPEEPVLVVSPTSAEITLHF